MGKNKTPSRASLSLQMLEDSKLPASFWAMDRDTFEQTEGADVFNRLDRFLKKFDGSFGIYLYGGIDSGKTFLISYLMKHLLVKGLVCRYITLDALVKLCFEDSQAQFEHFVAIPDVVALDNLDMPHTRKDAYLEVPNRFLRMRRDLGKPVLIGSRLTLSELADSYGADVQHYLAQTTYPVEATGNFAMAALARQERIREQMED